MGTVGTSLPEVVADLTFTPLRHGLEQFLLVSGEDRDPLLENGSPFPMAAPALSRPSSPKRSDGTLAQSRGVGTLTCLTTGRAVKGQPQG